jgi:hypothetical protein
LLVPADVVLAVYAMWSSLLLSAVFATHELLVASSKLDPILRFGIFLSTIAIIKLLPLKGVWVRYGAVVLMILFYELLAFDADGITSNDLWHMLVKAPIDVFVITRLFSKATSDWLASR